MSEPAKLPESTNQFSTLLQENIKKHIKLTEINYQRNSNSEYTERIEELDKNFDYSSNNNNYWGPPELSTLYGTPLYEEASSSQRIALNHLYWTAQYSHTAASESNTVLGNQVTAGVFSNLGGCETLCQELELETNQEFCHIHAFQSIGYKTKVALLGKKALNAPLLGKSYKLARDGSIRRLTPQPLLKFFNFNWETASSKAFQDRAFRFLTTTMHKSQGSYYSSYLKDLQKIDKKCIPAMSGGLAGLVAEEPLQKFFILNWGSSPFLASQYYAIRIIANISLKNYEYLYYKHFKQLEKESGFIPVPTAVSYYHLLDESFHTTTSRLIAQDLYKDFSKPTAYEKFLANLTVYMAQIKVLSGLSGGLVSVFRDDAYFMLSFYRLLQSPLFDMSASEALEWMHRCLCHEHQGFHVNLNFHRTLLSALRRFFDPIDYLWPVNREMRLMSAGSSISKAIQSNVKAFKQFSRSVTQN
ncbi:hypothetical protein NUACC21_66030 [Scytonema sp. NUACC21]